jgi:hypothetical protein
MVRGIPLLLPRLERDDDLFPRLQVFELDHAVRISGLQNLRALQSEVLPVAIARGISFPRHKPPLA